MSFGSSQILDHGSENPIVARLTLQIFAILDHCNISEKDRDAIKDIYMNSLSRKLLRCWEIHERYRLEFNKQLGSYTRPAAPSRLVTVPYVMRLEEEWHNFLYEAKNFVRDVLKAFNLLYGTGFTEASEYWPKKGKKSLLGFAESTFGTDEPRTKFLKEISPVVGRVVTFRNAVEHPGGHSGTLKIRNIRFEPDGRVSEPCWWIEKNGKNESESSIRLDSGVVIDSLLTLAEDIFVSWATENLKFPKFTRIAFIPEEKRDSTKPIKYVVDASAELIGKIAKLEAERGAKST